MTAKTARRMDTDLYIYTVYRWMDKEMDGKIHERQLWQMYGRWARWMVRYRGWMDGCEIEGSIDMQMDRRIDGETGWIRTSIRGCRFRCESKGSIMSASR